MKSFLRYNPTHATYNACDPGLGKSLMSITCAQELGFKKVLVISPSNMTLTWKREFENTPTSFINIDAILTSKDFKNIPTLDVVIISYGLATSALSPILAAKFDCIIIDEAHFLMNPQALRTKTILKKIWPHIPYRICLSGTPFRTCITNAYTVFSKMSPQMFPTLKDFGETYSNPRRTNWGIVYEGVRNHLQLSTLIRKQFFVRYRKPDVLTQLPKKTFQKILLPKSLSVPAFEQSLMTMYENALESPTKLDILDQLRSMPDHFMGEMRLQGELKIPHIKSYVEDLLNQGLPVILFAVNKSVVSSYTHLLKDFSPVVVDGSTTPTNRLLAVDKFQSGVTNLFIGNITAAGVGITLSRAEYVVFSQLTYSPSDLDQCISRAERIGMKNPLIVNYFVVENSLDERISSVCMERAATFSKVL